MHHKLADRTWGSLAPRLERLRRELRAGWINVRRYESVVVAPKVGQATRSIRRYLEANPGVVATVSLTGLASVGLGILVAVALS